jgi:dephospho-CoA kinase
VHELLASPDVRDLVVEQFGPEIAPGGSVDRSLVAERVFGDDDARQWLEEMLWPRVGERMVAWKASVDGASPQPPAAVVEVPLLFESGMESAFDHTIAVVADEEVRERRAAERGHAAVVSRAGRQLSQREKAEQADFVVRNDGSLDELKQRLSRVLATIGPT